MKKIIRHIGMFALALCLLTGITCYQCTQKMLKNYIFEEQRKDGLE